MTIPAGLLEQADPKPPGFLDRLKGKLFPAAATGLLSPEDIAAAQSQGLLGLGAALSEGGGWQAGPPVGLMQALGRGMQGGQQAFQGAMGQAGAQRMAGQQFEMGGLELQAKKAAAQRATQVQQQREDILKRMPPPEGATVDQMSAYLQKLLPEFIRINDTETVARLSELLKSTLNNTANGPKLDTVDIGGEKVDRLVYPDGRIQEVQRIKKTPTPKDPNAPDTAAQLREQRNFAREQQLGDDFNKDTTPFRKTAADLAGAIQEVPRAMNGDGAAQVNILYAFVKAMDPESAVREGEIGLARAAAPVWAQAQGYFQKYLQGESVVIPPILVQQMGRLMQRRYTGLEGRVQERIKYYRQRGKRWGVDPEVFTGIEPMTDAPAPAGGSGAPNPLLPKGR